MRNSKYQGFHREKMLVGIFIDLILKQSRSREPNRKVLKNLSRLQRSSTVIQETISEISRIDRVQRNLKLGGNTDITVRPKLTISQLRAFLFLVNKTGGSNINDSK